MLRVTEVTEELAPTVRRPPLSPTLWICFGTVGGLAPTVPWPGVVGKRKTASPAERVSVEAAGTTVTFTSELVLPKTSVTVRRNWRATRAPAATAGAVKVGLTWFWPKKLVMVVPPVRTTAGPAVCTNDTVAVVGF